LLEYINVEDEEWSSEDFAVTIVVLRSLLDTPEKQMDSTELTACPSKFNSKFTQFILECVLQLFWRFVCINSLQQRLHLLGELLHLTGVEGILHYLTSNHKNLIL